MPSFEVHPCIAEDIPRVFEIVSLAFGHDHEYMDAVFPAHSTPEGRKIGSERMLQTFHGDPYGHFMKLIDTDTGIIAAAAKWNIYRGGEVPPQPAIDGDYWDSTDDKEFAQALFYSFFTLRQRVIVGTDGNLVALEMMMVDPAFQCVGAGRLLLKWGLAKADELGVEVVVEGSERGRRLYASEGFEGPCYVVPVPEKFVARRKQVYYWMRRPAQKKGVTP